jgi:hypothetical protein
MVQQAVSSGAEAVAVVMQVAVAETMWVEDLISVFEWTTSTMADTPRHIH